MISKLWLEKLSDYLCCEDGSAVLTNLTGELVLETAFHTLTTAAKRRLLHLRDYFLFRSKLDFDACVGFDLYSDDLTGDVKIEG